MPLIAYLDETGDHSLTKIDKTFPVFALVLFACDLDEYINRLVPAIYRLKTDFFGHEGVIIHSRDIRKAQGDFGFLTDQIKKQQFYERLNAVMSDHNYALFASVINKQNHQDKYREYATNPYNLALEFTLERLVQCLEDHGQQEIVLVAEARGKREDDELRLSFLQLITYGTTYVKSERFKNISFQLVFKPKAMNIIGTQLADLIAYPTARYVLHPTQANPAYDIIKSKFYQKNGKCLGLKIFP